jgi:prevent-host-death family protein
MTDTQSLAEVKAHLSSYVDRVEREHERVLITRNGRPAALLVSPDDLEALEATIELLSDPVAMRELAEAEADHREGRTIGLDEFRAEFGL